MKAAAAVLVMAVAGCALPEPLVRTGAEFVEVSAGGNRSCGLDADGLVFCWGRDFDGSAVTFPTQVVFGPVAFRQVSVGRDYTCALIRDGGPVCWAGVRGRPYTLPGGPSLERIELGAFPCGVTSAGAIWCWQNGTGDGTETAAAGALSGLSIDAFACGLTPTGQAKCWGGPFPNVPTAILDTMTWEQIEPMTGWACAVPIGGSAKCFTVTPGAIVGTPTQVDLLPLADGTRFMKLSGAANRVVMISDGGRAYMKTINQFYATPEGSTLDWASIQSGTNHTCGKLADGRFACFWDNSFGQLGDGTISFRVNATLIGGGAP